MHASSRAIVTLSAVFAGTLALSASQSTSTVPAPAGSVGAPAAAATPAAGTTPAAGAQSAAAADDKNAPVYARVCSLCHDAQRILSNRRTRDQWSEVIDKMIERGAQGSDDDFAAVLEYLVSHYGRINVNRGAEKDLAGVLKLSDAEAAAIVAYRKDHGPIPDFDTLSKIPGLDVEKLGQVRDAISY